MTLLERLERANKVRHAHAKKRRGKIVLFDKNEIKVRRPPGRPRTVDPNNPYGHYLGRRGKGRPFCVARGCGRLLRISQPLVCSDLCGDAVFNLAMGWLRQLGVSKQDIINHLKKVG